MSEILVLPPLFSDTTFQYTEDFDMNSVFMFKKEKIVCILVILIISNISKCKKSEYPALGCLLIPMKTISIIYLKPD